jgi:LDH2 family malate/lactate/ureidoglycolate dehydrogenase
MALVRVDGESLKAFTKEVFVRAGLAPADAGIEAEVLVWANLRGVDSHGVLRIPSYLASVEAGGMNPNPNIRVLKETAATALIEADHAFGPVVTTFAMSRMIQKAKSAGIGWALIRNTTHQGAMAYYALMAAKEDMAGVAIVCSPPNMAPYGASAPGVHNSPVAIAVPANKHRPLCLDMATSVAAGGKVMLAVDKGIPMPEGWALDKEGKPTTDPKQVGALLPFGGYKGYGLALMFECLSSLMVGNPLLEARLLGGEPVPRGTQNSIVAAIDISMFTDAEAYKDHVDKAIDGIKGLPKAEGFDQILVPGEPEDATLEERVREGIPLPDGTVQKLRDVAKELGMEMPRWL